LLNIEGNSQELC